MLLCLLRKIGAFEQNVSESTCAFVRVCSKYQEVPLRLIWRWDQSWPRAIHTHRGHWQWTAFSTCPEAGAQLTFKRKDLDHVFLSLFKALQEVHLADTAVRSALTSFSVGTLYIFCPCITWLLGFWRLHHIPQNYIAGSLVCVKCTNKCFNMMDSPCPQTCTYIESALLGFRSSWKWFQTFTKKPAPFMSKRKVEVGQDDLSLPLLLLRAENRCGEQTRAE